MMIVVVIFVCINLTMMIFNNLDDIGLHQALCIVKLKGPQIFSDRLGCLNL